MIVSAWPGTFNSKFYGFNEKVKENVKLTEFASGRVIGTQINTKKIMTYTCNVRFTKQELYAFWNWFNDVLGQTAGCFTCSAIGSSIYRFTSIPEPQDTDLKTRTLSLEFEEVF